MNLKILKEKQAIINEAERQCGSDIKLLSI